MAVGTSVKAVRMVGLNAATLTGGYDVINPLGLTHSCSMLRIINTSGVPVTISYDGVTPHDYVSAGSSLTLPLQITSTNTGNVSNMAKGTKIYAKGAAGVGQIYVAGYYQD